MKARVHEEIAKRAYALWEAEDRADGRHVEHWLRAEAAWIAERRHAPQAVVRSKPVHAEREVRAAADAV